ncbi:ankyrin repeat domain-containing protein [Methylomonas albis]|uniref:Ankyrin repeat domain-containing protein n=1 Tax=Methylomonas albis TaxID=1854563 RepID=A0ABR9CV02_9GAMM|nr:ankyrin repeat domain-containing protein [Methylomonas albis]MBD9354672.1 ankyrin repeat domain-containing protein [Methylomonas albis]
MNKNLKTFAGIVLALTFNFAHAADIFDLARNGSAKAITEYVKQGGEVNVANEDGYTPLILAAYHGRLTAVQALHVAGALACSEDSKGNNALMGVAFKGDMPTARWFLDNGGCDVNHQNRAGQTALMMASLFGREAIIQLLMKHGARADIQDLQGNSAASLAQAQGLSRVVSIIKQLASLR